jgi:flagellar biosynthesis protein FlhG
VTSGKGGVGKTNFTVALAIYLRRQGKRVVVIDADFGLANVELIFGVTPKYSLADVLFVDKRLSDVLTEGPLGVLFLSGGSGFGALANISERQMTCLIENFEYLDSVSDIILIDTGAGISKSVVRFVKASNETILITTPEPTSITDVYALIKTVRESGEPIPIFKVVVNKVDSEREGAEVFEKLNGVSKKFMEFALTSLGSVPQDNNLVKAVKRQQPVALCFPDTPFSKSLSEISARLLDIRVSPEQEKSAGMISFVKRLCHMLGG